MEMANVSVGFAVCSAVFLAVGLVRTLRGERDETTFDLRMAVVCLTLAALAGRSTTNRQAFSSTCQAHMSAAPGNPSRECTAAVDSSEDPPR